MEFEDDWVASRKIGSNLYLVARKYPEFYALLEADRPSTRAAARPKFRDTATGETFTRLSISNCFYFPDFDDPNYLLIADIDVSDPNSQLDLNAYLGAGEQIYASTQNLYVTASRPGDIFFAAPTQPRRRPGGNGSACERARRRTHRHRDASPAVIALPYTEQTDIYKFSLNNGHTSFVATATVPGSILNQYSMDENNTYFRVATTQHGWWHATGQDNNNLLVLDANMSVVGSLTNVAAGEQIYAARFLGNRAFLVAFQQIDPLFAIDLSDPPNPTIVGQLTLPGYSNFLLPYDENHLIGFGKDVIVAQGETDGDVP